MERSRVGWVEAGGGGVGWDRAGVWHGWGGALWGRAGGIVGRVGARGIETRTGWVCGLGWDAWNGAVEVELGLNAWMDSSDWHRIYR